MILPTRPPRDHDLDNDPVFFSIILANPYPVLLGAEESEQLLFANLYSSSLRQKIDLSFGRYLFSSGTLSFLCTILPDGTVSRNKRSRLSSGADELKLFSSSDGASMLKKN